MWQPIETAPKDGTWVIVYCGEEIDDEVEGRNVAVAQYTNQMAFGDTSWHWHFAWFDGGYYGRLNEVTHWMPLPEPPQ